jgi:hypothetical protein
VSRPPEPPATRQTDWRAPGGRYLGSWVLPSGNTAHVRLGPGWVITFDWDVPPAPVQNWSDEDLRHFRAIACSIERDTSWLAGRTLVVITRPRLAGRPG